nr:MAG TPA: hypothetical protein [Caudoviricetes sp.]
MRKNRPPYPIYNSLHLFIVHLLGILNYNQSMP